ncbi:protease complex subunit PrcB family protein [Flavobacterium hauense]
MRKIIFSGLLLAAMVSCQSDDAATTNSQKNDPVVLEFTSVGKENLYGNGAEDIGESNLVINDNDAWQNLLAEMTAVNTLPLNFGDTNIDFSQWTVIATFDKIQSYGGFSIDVVSVTEGDTQIVVDVEKSSGGPGAAATVITQPFHIVKIPKTSLPVTFE